ncbi:protein mono-ADP-ribosyltransferase PARP12-like isoform X2 [Engraulis encrasicolus]|uniref:protein mono-ADP-ribosyltransferase PARP12-like isoform X2 n=1 Tax=Engraulis encrasicolus TaxID=184585 RepID=UPI002FD51779
MEADIVRFLCVNGGAMEYDLLLELAIGFPDMDSSEFDSLLRNKELFFQTEIAGVKQVLAKTSLRLCKVTDCSGCKDLHLCKFYLQGECNRRQCRYGHDLNSDHNAEVLSDHQLEKFNRAEIRQLLLQNDTPHSLLPPICSKYNRGEGEYGQCEDKDECSRLHVCEGFMRHTCDADACGRSHDLFEPQPVRVLRERGVSTQQVGSMRSVYHHILLLRGRRQGDPGGGGAGAVAGGRGRARGRGGQGRGGRGRGGRGRGFSDRDADHGGTGGRGRGRGWNRGRGSQDMDQGGRGGRERGGRGRGFSDTDQDVEQGGTGGSRDGSCPPQPEVAEICLSFVKGFCKYENRCVRVHCKMPYLWQVRSGDTWSDLENNEDIERDYCNPDHITTFSLQGQPVQFNSMRCGDQEVRRLSTAPSVQKPDFILTTEWIWYWQNEHSIWTQYIPPMCSVSSCDLEKRYQADSKDVVLFTGGKPPHLQQYQLSFKDMEQRNVCYGTVRVVRRRPKFISAEGVQTAKTRRRGPTSSQPGRGVPGYWDRSAVPDTGYQRVTLLSSDRDYQKVQELFNKTLRGYDIISIERVQNKELWEDFQTKRERMQKANKDKKYGDGSRLLFHGTDPKHVQAICHHNFDWRKCGANGTVYGEGCYFARDASYSHNYTKEVLDHDSRHQRCMFVCRVLIGSYTRGHSHYRLPPSVDGEGLLMYDSCVNDVRDPSIFVVFDKQQVYPEFLLTYAEYVRPSSSSSTDSDDSTAIVSAVASARNTVTVSTLTSSSVTPPPLLTPPPVATLPAQTLPPPRPPHLSPTTTSSSFSSSSSYSASHPTSLAYHSASTQRHGDTDDMWRWSNGREVKKKDECILL